MNLPRLRLLSALVLFFIIPAYCKAQGIVGIKIGFNYNSFIDQLNNDRFDERFGFIAGMIFESKLNEGLYFNAEMVWEQKNGYTDLTEQTINLNYISTYMGPKISIFSDDIDLSLGLNFGVLVNKEVKTKLVQNESYEFNLIDFGPWFGICHEAPNSAGKITFEIRFFKGLININDQNSRFPLSAGSAWTKNQNLQFCLYYFFNHRK